MKKILLVRHAIAADRDDWAGHDFDRPLTEKGIEKFSKSLDGIKQLCPKITAVYSSGLLRALQTAQLLADHYSLPVVKDIALNSGNLPRDVAKFISSEMKKHEGVVAFVGHEPELCLVLSQMCSRSLEESFFKKGAMALIEMKGSEFHFEWIKKNKELRKLSN